VRADLGEVGVSVRLGHQTLDVRHVELVDVGGEVEERLRRGQLLLAKRVDQRGAARQHQPRRAEHQDIHGLLHPAQLGVVPPQRHQLLPGAVEPSDGAKASPCLRRAVEISHGAHHQPTHGGAALQHHDPRAANGCVAPACLAERR
jgi:hypothetical protein